MTGIICRPVLNTGLFLIYSQDVGKITGIVAV